MNHYRFALSTVATLLISLLFNSGAFSQVPTTAEWSTKIWSAASDGNWSSVNSLLNEIPDGEDYPLVSFRKQLDDYRSHRATEIQLAQTARDAAIVEMNKHLQEGNTVKAMRSAVEAQTLSKNLDDVLFNEDVQRVLTQTQKEINSLTKNGDMLTAQNLLYSLRTFYEDTSRRDLYERWNDQLEKVALHVSLLRQYAPKHLHTLFADLAVIRGDEPIEEFNEQASDNWKERIDGIDKNMVIRSLDIAINEHVDGITWESLIKGGLEAVRKLGEVPVISETFEKAGDSGCRTFWLESIDEELQTYPQYLKHIHGKRVLIQILDRILSNNKNSMQLPEGVVLREFGDGAMGELDKYSSIIWPDESRRFNQQTEGRFVGVGIVIKENNRGEIIVVNPIEGSPAYYGGMQPDDVIIAVNGKSSSGWSLNDAVDRITGPKGTAVTITVRRTTSEKPVDVFLTRDSVKLHSVQGWWKKELDDDGQPIWDWFIDEDNRIGYLKLSGFSEESYTDMLAAIREMQTEGQPNGLILDLRYNPGGLLPTARRIANLFVNSGTIVSGETANGEELFKMRALPSRAYLSDWPVIILINKGSASASEIVAGCVQAHDAGIVVGQQSWGKGSVQTVHQISKVANLKLTTQFYRLPSSDGGVTPGRLVHKRRGSNDWGIIPDVEVSMSPDQITQSNELRQKADMLLIDSEDNRPDINKLISDGLDPQLETALLILRANAISRLVTDHRQAQLN
ncbi:MAG: S41 family peptidase [Phycisphaerales bacterium]|jgi:carboxyl-terminal processing protease|nr:S41 family peptidase [Phycisphaerales bacterium]